MMTIDSYLDKLAARSPVPGGGSAAALTGAIGISLLSMVARYIAKKSKRTTIYRKLTKILEFTEYSRRHLRKLMREDEAAYLKLSEAIKKRGTKDISKFYKDAAEVPLEISAILKEGIDKCKELCAYCTTTLASDLAEVSLLLEAGFLSAKLNVEINLIGIKDASYAKQVNNFLLRHKIAISKTKKAILNKIYCC